MKISTKTQVEILLLIIIVLGAGSGLLLYRSNVHANQLAQQAAYQQQIHEKEVKALKQANQNLLNQPTPQPTYVAPAPAYTAPTHCSSYTYGTESQFTSVDCN